MEGGWAGIDLAWLGLGFDLKDKVAQVMMRERMWMWMGMWMLDSER